MEAQAVKTRFLVISDTHGLQFPDDRKPLEPVNVVIHCGDLTQGSKLHEFEDSIRLLKGLNAPLKLVIAGNHDFTLDTPMFKKKIAEVRPPLEPELVEREYGAFGQAEQLLFDASSAGIVFLNEDTHQFDLANGAHLTIYASPYTPSTNDWGFQYDPKVGHDWDINPQVDIVITHGPPRGILDMTASKERIGCPGLFQAVASARPLMHCFGHVHDSWGGRLVKWRAPMPELPSHFSAIQNEKSITIESLARLRDGRFDTPEVVQEREDRKRRYKGAKLCLTKHCKGDDHPLAPGSQTLFVNAAIQGSEEDPFHYPWLVELDLPSAEGPKSSEITRSSDKT
ncbi:hypothetical protein FSARC_1764 [Fusarium sarcochroum]|uniref:Calcineurin-like phosphoesterase domain-containing protein n=1 Tax=Fusarium sarcochroum TaxID=1208366 RepID=A0A8H4U7R1_9HYPO|nr:hypothetical protein FSARC_1764 [Fusarium sarcochroum]